MPEMLESGGRRKRPSFDNLKECMIRVVKLKNIFNRMFTDHTSNMCRRSNRGKYRHVGQNTGLATKF